MIPNIYHEKQNCKGGHGKFLKHLLRRYSLPPMRRQYWCTKKYCSLLRTQKLYCRRKGYILLTSDKNPWTAIKLFSASNKKLCQVRDEQPSETAFSLFPATVGAFRRTNECWVRCNSRTKIHNQRTLQRPSKKRWRYFSACALILFFDVSRHSISMWHSPFTCKCPLRSCIWICLNFSVRFLLGLWLCGSHCYAGSCHCF